jgi:glycogen(starch) synthase
VEKRAKILMLGWEFPPLLTGGLGQACYGLFNALSNYADLTVILPRSEKSVRLNNTDIIGLNTIGLKDVEVQRKEHSFEKFSEVTYVESDFYPYPVNISYQVNASDGVEFSMPPKTLEEVRKLYSTNVAYGPNILEKIATYADVVTQIALTKEFDVIHAHDWITFPAALNIKKLTGKPLVVHIHSLETDRVGLEAAKNGHNLAYDIEYAAMKQADIVIPVSQFTKDCIIRNYDIDSTKITPIYNAVDTKTHSYRQEKNIDDKLVVYLGRVTHQKGPEYLIDIAEKVTSTMPNVKFVIAGTGDKLKQMLQETSAKRLGSKFIFTGFLSKDKVNQLLAQADIYIMPSVSEPFGLSALEAAQFDVPCILSRQAGVSEFLSSALKADYWDTDKFANYIHGLFNYPALGKEMTRNSKKEINRLTWDLSAQQVLEVYNQLLN